MDCGNNASASTTSASPPQQHRDANKSPVNNMAVKRRQELATAIGRERREALIRAKRRTPISGSNEAATEEADMVIDGEETSLEARTAHAVGELKTALSSQGDGAQNKRTEALRALRCLLSQSEVPPIEAAVKAEAVPLLVHCLTCGSSDEEYPEAVWSLTIIITARETEEVTSLLPALPLLIAHLENSSTTITEQCAWAIGAIADAREDLGRTLLAQGALRPLAGLMLSSKGSTVIYVTWALANLIKGPDFRAANELISIKGVLNVVMMNLETADEELATEVARVMVFFSNLSEKVASLIVRSHVPRLLIGHLLVSKNLELLVPVLYSLGNLVACDAFMVDSILIVGRDITDQALSEIIRCLRTADTRLTKEAPLILSNIAAGSSEHKKLIFTSEATPSLIHLLTVTSGHLDGRQEAASTLISLCVVQAGSTEPPNIIVEHLVSIINCGALQGFMNLLRCAYADEVCARFGLQFVELVMRGYPNGQGINLVQRGDIEAIERFQFHENDIIRNMAISLVNTYFGQV